jgi:hypothetical protein
MRANPVWAEAVQLVPVLVLAFPIVSSGQVHLPSLGTAFTVAAALALPVGVAVTRAGHTLNPIVLGTYLWLVLGAVGFGLGVPPLADLLAAWQGFALFAVVFAVLLGALTRPTGAIGARGEPATIRRVSLGLLGLSLLAVGWAWVFRDDVRLGGGLPFIVLNVARRVAIARGSRP